MTNRKQTQHSWTAAATFAEAGEWETARTFIPPTRRSRLLAWLERTSMVVTFAEAGMPEEAMRHTTQIPAHTPPSARNFLELCGLSDARLTFGVVSPVRLGVKA